MPTVHFPPQMRDLTDGTSEVVVEGGSVRQVIAALDARFPGLAGRVVTDDKITPGLAISIDNEINSLGLFAKVREDSVIHFIPAIAGG